MNQRRALSFSLVLLASLDAGCSSSGTPGASSAGGSDATSGATTGAGGRGAGGAASASSGSGAAGSGSGASSGTGGAPPTQAWKCPAGNYQSPNVTGLVAARIAGAPPVDGFSPGYSVVEGPVWIGDALYFSQIASDGKPPVARLLKLLPATGTVTIAAATSGTNGLATDEDGALLAATHKDGSISRFALGDLDHPTVLAGAFMGARFNSPNDLAVRSDGNVYFSDPDYQAPSPAPQAKTRIYRVAPGGSVTVVDDTIYNPNGVTLSLDESTLYVTGTSGLLTYPVMADGSVGPGKVVNPSLGGDGLVLDCAGDLYVTGSQGVTVISPAGMDIGHIALSGADGVDGTTNVAFGGPDRKTLFITARGGKGGVFSVAMSLPGMPY